MKKIIDGKAIAEEIKHEVRREIVKKKLTPGLAVILVGDDPASHLYVKLKKKSCEQVGIEFHRYFCSSSTSEKEVIEAIDFLNKDPKINAILVQLPLPKGLDENKIIQSIDPAKDVDGFHPENLKKLLKGRPDVIPGLAQGIIKLIESTKEELENKKTVIISNSRIFSKPLEKLLEDKKIKVESYLSKEKNLSAKISQADILIVAVGKKNFIKAKMVKEGCIVIDVGTNRVKDKVFGDVDFKNVFKKAAWITPVPGGVGPMTIAMLLKNTLELAKKQTQHHF